MQGERELVQDCRSLARFALRGIPALPAGGAHIRVTFQVDADGLLSVTAMEKSTGVEASIQVKPSYGLTDGEIATMIKDSMSYAEQDIQARMLAEQKVEAARVLESLTSALAADAALLSARSVRPSMPLRSRYAPPRQATTLTRLKKRLKISTHKPRNSPLAVWISRSVSR